MLPFELSLVVRSDHIRMYEIRGKRQAAEFSARNRERRTTRRRVPSTVGSRRHTTVVLRCSGGCK